MKECNDFIHRDIFHKTGKIKMFDISSYDRYRGKLKTKYSRTDEEDDDDH